MATYEFADFELDLESYELRHSGESTGLGAKPLEVLAYLVRQQPRVVGPAELLSGVWGVTAMSTSTVPTAIAAARRALGDDPSNARFIETVRGRGYRFIGSATFTRDAESRRGDQLPFVGRQEELGILRASLSEAAASSLRAVFLTGEPGIGKTRAIEEFLLEDLQFLHLAARCQAIEGAPAFRPWGQIVRDLVSRMEQLEPRTDPDHIIAPVRELLPPERTAPTQPHHALFLDPAQAQFRLFDGVTTLLREVALSDTIVLTFDDLHQADESSLRILRFVVRELVDSRVLILGTFREFDAHTDAVRRSALSDLACDSRSIQVRLKGLSPVE